MLGGFSGSSVRRCLHLLTSMIIGQECDQSRALILDMEACFVCVSCPSSLHIAANFMTTDTTLGIRTPLNTVVVLPCFNATADNILQQLLASSDIGALVLGDLPGYDWEIYPNLPLSGSAHTMIDIADCGVCHSFLTLTRPPMPSVN